jgi:crotonobetainyl-CoA:carnitine CoA-transferase CaiB-like acyl-CoA transferase
VATSERTQPGLLEGVRVLDFGIWRPVPYATQLLVEMGADVIKIEPPAGDPMRVFPDLFAVLNAGKRAVAVDLKNDDERAAVLALAKDADVALEGYRPGVADRLGIGYDALRSNNPGLVYCSLSGFGQTGPLRDVPGHDLNYQAVAGVIEPRGPEGAPVVGRPPIADLAAGVFAAMAVCAALVRATRTGEGDYIDVSMTDVLATWTGPLPALQVKGGPVLGGGVPGYGSFRTADDKWVVLGVIDEQHLWDALTSSLGLKDMVGQSFTDRLARMDDFNARIAERLAAMSRDEAVARLTPAGVPISPVRGQGELADDPQLQARGVMTRRADGSVQMGHPLIYRDHPAHVPSDVPPLRVGAASLPSWARRS